MGGKSLARQASEAEAQEMTQALGLDVSGRYHTGFGRRATDHCMLGATNAELALVFGVSQTTIEQWLVDHAHFRKAVALGREMADVKVVRSLYRRATGLKVTKQRIATIEGKQQVVDLKEELPPDVGAAQFWLTNRQRTRWKDTKSVEHSGRVDLAALISDLHGQPVQALQPPTIEHDADEE